MQIISVKAIPFSLTPRRDFKWAGLKVDLGGFTLVEIRADDGTVGYGECTPLPDWGSESGRRGGETVAGTTQMIRDVLGPCLIGLDPTAPVPARLAMDAALIGNSYAKCATDIALHDLWGKATGQPVYKLLGGACRPSVATDILCRADLDQSWRAGPLIIEDSDGTVLVPPDAQICRDPADNLVITP